MSFSNPFSYKETRLMAMIRSGLDMPLENGDFFKLQCLRRVASRLDRLRGERAFSID